MSEREPEPVDETDDSAKLYVADPDDYAKTRKLKALNDAKSHVRKSRNNLPTTARGDEWEGHHARLAEAVASYGHELLPLLEDAEANGVIDESDYTTPAIREEIDVRTFLTFDGRLPQRDDLDVHGKPHPSEIMCVYRHLQRLERELGFGLSFEEETNDEWEIET